MLIINLINISWRCMFFFISKNYIKIGILGVLKSLQYLDTVQFPQQFLGLKFQSLYDIWLQPLSLITNHDRTFILIFLSNLCTSNSFPLKTLSFLMMYVVNINFVFKINKHKNKLERLILYTKMNIWVIPS